MSNPIVQRLAKGFAAHGLNQVLIIIVQIVSVPLFLTKWGAEHYGEWIAITAIPAYLTISDLSFGATAANEMTMLAGAGKESEAQRIYRSVWVLVLALSAIVMVIASLLVLSLPFDRWLNLHTFTRQEVVLTMLFLIGQVVLAQQGAVIGAAFRAGGYYPTGVWANDSLRFLEFIVLAGIVLSGGGAVAVTGWVLVVRAASYLVQYAYVRRLVPWLSLGFDGATKEAIRPLVGPALAYNALPLAQATTLQGTILVVKAVAGPTAVVVFTTTRTVTRMVLQTVTMLANATWPEFSRALGAGQTDVARRLHRRACQVGVWLSISASLVIGACGPWLYEHWVRGKAPFHLDVFVIMLVTAIVGSLWTISYVVPVSINRHQKLTVAYFAATLIGLVFSIVLGKLFGLPGVALGLLPVDLIMVAVVLPMSMGLLEDSEGYASLLRPPFRWFAKKIAGLFRRKPEGVS